MKKIITVFVGFLLIEVGIATVLEMQNYTKKLDENYNNFEYVKIFQGRTSHW